MKKFLIVASSLVLFGCGSKLSGVYSQNRPPQGKISYEFKSNGKVLIDRVDDGMKFELPYELDGKNIKLISPQGGAAVLTLVDADTIEGPMGMKLVKER